MRRLAIDGGRECQGGCDEGEPTPTSRCSSTHTVSFCASPHKRCARNLGQCAASAPAIGAVNDSPSSAPTRASAVSAATAPKTIQRLADPSRAADTRRGPPCHHAPRSRSEFAQGLDQEQRVAVRLSVQRGDDAHACVPEAKPGRRVPRSPLRSGRERRLSDSCRAPSPTSSARAAAATIRRPRQRDRTEPSRRERRRAHGEVCSRSRLASRTSADRRGGVRALALRLLDQRPHERTLQLVGTRHDGLPEGPWQIAGGGERGGQRAAYGR
jgi:hypothetical protein